MDSARASPIVVADLADLATEPRDLPVYDGTIGLRLLYEDAESGEEHYLARYPAGLGASWHRHTAPHTIVVLAGRLDVNGAEIGPGSYCHYPAGVPMRHAPAGGEACEFVLIFHGPFDAEEVDPPDAV